MYLKTSIGSIGLGEGAVNPEKIINNVIGNVVQLV